jgi:hypothetical protein
MENPETLSAEQSGGSAEARGYAAGDEYDYDPEHEDDACLMCGGDGVVMLSECGPSEWGEDCFCEEDRVVTCPECRERERYEQMRKQQEAKRHNDPSSGAAKGNHETT